MLGVQSAVGEMWVRVWQSAVGELMTQAGQVVITGRRPNSLSNLVLPVARGHPIPPSLTLLF